MESETDDLRRQSQSRNSKSQSQSHSTVEMQMEMREYTQPLQPRETPQIERNRAMRNGTLREGSQGPGTPGRRRSSLSGRGKRASSSFEANGVISAFSHPFTVIFDDFTVD